MDYPSSPSGRDLSLTLKASSDGELTTASGRLFQELTTRCEKKFDIMRVHMHRVSPASNCSLVEFAVTE